MRYILGIDVGTTGTRAVLVDQSGAVVKGATTDHLPISILQPQWAEQEPEDWWQATVSSVRKVLSQSGVSAADIAGIGLSGQMHGVVLLDKDYNVLRPSIIWCDQRSQAQADWFTDRIGKQRLIEITCNPALTGFSVPKFLWVRDNQPEIYSQMRKLLLPKDYIRFRLTSEFATEVSDAAGTLLLDVPERRWSSEILNALELDEDLLPRVYESPEITGRITRAAAEATGLKEGTPVVGGGGDQAAGAVGNGVVAPGIISSTIGTSGVVFAFTERPSLDPKGRVHTFCHAVPGKWHVMGVTQGAGLSLRWFRDNFGGQEIQIGQFTGSDPYELLAAEAAQAQAGCEGLIFLPYLMGERTPHLDPNARGVLFGLTARHNRSHVIRAILEGVAYSLRDTLEIFKEMDVPVEQVRASGGGGRSGLWRQIQADVFNTEIVTINATEGSAYGAALLAAVGTGIFSTVEEACSQTIKVVDRCRPDAKAAKVYEEHYQVYRSLYGALKPQFDRVTELANR